jgi:hypothetical protein
VPGHLQVAARTVPPAQVPRRPAGGAPTVGVMKKLILLAALIGLTAFAVRKLRVG